MPQFYFLNGYISVLKTDDEPLLKDIWDCLEKNSLMSQVIGIFLVEVNVGLVKMKPGKKPKIV